MLDVLLEDCKIGIPLHSFRQSVRDEFVGVSGLNLDSEERIKEQLSHYTMFVKQLLDSKPLWTGIIARESCNSVDEFVRIWCHQVLRYSRRDQLSIRQAQKLSGIKINEVEIDNYNSEWHQWPILNNRQEKMRFVDNKIVELEIKLLQDLLNESEETIAKINEESILHLGVIRQYQESNSWRITKPLRSLSKFVRRLTRSNY